MSGTGNGKLTVVAAGADTKKSRAPRAPRPLPPKPATMVGDTWERQLVLDGNGLPKGILANVTAILQHSPAWAGVIAYDESRGEIVMANPGPTADLADDAAWTARAWTDADDTAAAVWIQRTWKLRCAPDTIAQAVGLIASERRINPLTDYLSGLTWDGVPRLATWLIVYAGAPDQPYTRGAGAAWLRSAVARAFQPGCKADAALVLEGGQGKGKSTLLAVLGGEWFTDDITDLHSKDAAQQVRKSWICELPEMAAGRRSEVEAQKAFVARQVDRYRPAYGRRVVADARRCVFAGTTNSATYLQDGTGNRRWLPVACGTIDLEALKRDRDQLWAEAVATYRAGAGWTLAAELWGDAAEQQEARHLGDVWEDAVAEWVDGRDQVAIDDILGTVIGLPIERRGRSEQMRVAGILARLKWWRGQVRVGKARPWRYFPPVPDMSPTPAAPTPSPTPLEPNGAAEKAALSPTSPTFAPSDETYDEVRVDGYTAVSPFTNKVGDVGDVGDNSVNHRVSSVTNGGTNPSKTDPGVGDATNARPLWSPLCPKCAAPRDAAGQCPNGHENPLASGGSDG